MKLKQHYLVLRMFNMGNLDNEPNTIQTNKDKYAQSLIGQPIHCWCNAFEALWIKILCLPTHIVYTYIYIFNR